MEVGVCANVDLTKFLVLDNSNTKVKWKCPEYAVKMVEEGAHADVTFEVAEGGSVKAHRSVLVSVSEVFAAMFRHNMKEELTSTVQISDITLDALKLFLLLLYTTKDNNDDGMNELNVAIDKNFKELHVAITKYLVESALGSVYITALRRNLNSENCWFYHLSYKYKSTAYHVSLQYILTQYEKAVESDSFLDAVKQDPERVCLWLGKRSLLVHVKEHCKALAGKDFEQKIAALCEKALFYYARKRLLNRRIDV